MQHNRLPEEVFQTLRDYEKRYGVIWFKPTQNDAITTLLRQVQRLFREQRRFKPHKQETLMTYHRAVNKAAAALKALRAKKANDVKTS